MTYPVPLRDQGTWAPRLIPSAGLHARKPPSASWETAAAVPVPALTAEQVLSDALNIRAGEQLLVNGAGGVTGGLLVALAALRGAQVIATAGPASQQRATPPRICCGNRDSIYGSDAGRLLESFGTEEFVIAPRAPWQNPFVEHVIGALRRECLDHVIVWNERSLRRTLRRFLDYYHEWRMHLSLDKDAPPPRAQQPPACPPIIQVSHVD